MTHFIQDGCGDNEDDDIQEFTGDNIGVFSHLASLQENFEPAAFTSQLQNVTFAYRDTAPIPKQRFGDTMEEVQIETEASRLAVRMQNSIRHIVNSVVNSPT